MVEINHLIGIKGSLDAVHEAIGCAVGGYFNEGGAAFPSPL
jgi:hypothetical protein